MVKIRNCGGAVDRVAFSVFSSLRHNFEHSQIICVIQLDEEGKPIERTAATSNQDIQFKCTVKKLVKFDCETGDARQFLRELFPDEINPTTECAARHSALSSSPMIEE